jgi:amino-acid N-acetyltransferase
MSTSAAAARLAGEISRPAARAIVASGLPTGSLLRLTPTRRLRGRGIRCCAARNPGAVESGEEFVRFFREAWPYIRGHRGSTFVVVISSEVVSGPHFDGILQVLGFGNY